VADVYARVDAHAPTIAAAQRRGAGRTNVIRPARVDASRYGPQGDEPFSAARATMPSTISNA